MEVSEIFYSISGEGKSIGVPSVFIRLSGCNLRCSFCDSIYSWKDGKKISVSEVLKKVLKYNCSNIIITGGEPFWKQKEELKELILGLSSNGYNIEIETNGMFPIFLPVPYLTYNISPKLMNSDNFAENRDVLKDYKHVEGFRTDCSWKFVVKSEADLKDIDDFVGRHDLMGDVYLMPEGKDRETILERSKWLVEECKKRKYNFSTRLQILIWGNKRGV